MLPPSLLYPCSSLSLLPVKSLPAPAPLLTLASPSFSPVLDPCRLPCRPSLLAPPSLPALPPLLTCSLPAPSSQLRCILLPPLRTSPSSIDFPSSPTLRTVVDTPPVRHQHPRSMAHEVFPVSWPAGREDQGHLVLQPAGRATRTTPAVRNATRCRQRYGPSVRLSGEWRRVRSIWFVGALPSNC